MILAVAVLVQLSVCIDGCELSKDLLVCTDKSIVERLDELRTDGDQEAFREYATAAFLAFLATGEGCTAWDAGTEIFAKRDGFFSSIAEVRKRGSSLRHWALANTIEAF